MSKIVIVYHSGYGHTAKVAEAVAATSGGTLLAIDAEGNLPEGGWEQLAAADAIVFGSPTYMGSPAGSSRSSPTPAASPGSPAVEGQAGRRLHQQRHAQRRQARTLHYLFTLASSTACCGWAWA
jgi:NAD(P)H dehydrogenase (quinone)